VNQEESEQYEVDGMKKGADSTGKVMHLIKSDIYNYILQNTRFKKVSNSWNNLQGYSRSPETI